MRNGSLLCFHADAMLSNDYTLSRWSFVCAGHIEAKERPYFTLASKGVRFIFLQ